MAAYIDDNSLGEVVQRETVEAAIRIGRDYFLPHARAALELMGADPRIADAKRVLRWLADPANSVKSVKSVKGVRVLSQRDVRALILGSHRTDEESDGVIRLLLNRGFMRPYIEEAKSGPGRKPSPKYEIHPSVFKAGPPSHNSQNSQNDEPPQDAPCEGEGEPREEAPEGGSYRAEGLTEEDTQTPFEGDAA
jgi:hypothetical protein